MSQDCQTIITLVIPAILFLLYQRASPDLKLFNPLIQCPRFILAAWESYSLVNCKLIEWFQLEWRNLLSHFIKLKRYLATDNTSIIWISYHNVKVAVLRKLILLVCTINTSSPKRGLLLNYQTSAPHPRPLNVHLTSHWSNLTLFSTHYTG